MQPKWARKRREAGKTAGKPAADGESSRAGVIRASEQARELPPWLLVSGLFFIALVLVRAAIGHRIALSIDEGIYLAGAERLARGEIAYRDLFLLTGPGTFWLYDIVFRLFGPSLPKARLVVSAEIALLTTAVFWLLRRLTGRAPFALAAAAAFAGRAGQTGRFLPFLLADGLVQLRPA